MIGLNMRMILMIMICGLGSALNGSKVIINSIGLLMIKDGE